jgi:hypothetical protein
LLAHLRAAALELGLWPDSPCTHAGLCPLLGRHDRGWCHDVTRVAAAPRWLHDLTAAAGLGKKTLSLSHLFLRTGMPKAKGPGLPARVLSDAFAVPGAGLARYGCTARGLVLIPAAGSLERGSLVDVRPVVPPRQDARSQAWIVERSCSIHAIKKPLLKQKESPCP